MIVTLEQKTRALLWIGVASAAFNGRDSRVINRAIDRACAIVAAENVAYWHVSDGDDIQEAGAKIARLAALIADAPEEA